MLAYADGRYLNAAKTITGQYVVGSITAEDVASGSRNYPQYLLDPATHTRNLSALLKTTRSYDTNARPWCVVLGTGQPVAACLRAFPAGRSPAKAESCMCGCNRTIHNGCMCTVLNGNWMPQHPQQLHRALKPGAPPLSPLRRLHRFRNAVARRQPSFTEYSSVSDAGAYTIAYSIPILDTNGSVAHVAASSILASSIEGAVRVPCCVCAACVAPAKEPQ